VLLGAVSLALYSFDDRDYVVIGYDQWLVQTSLTTFVVILALSFVPLYFLIRLLRGVWVSPRSLRAWGRYRRERRANRFLTQGLTSLAEGRWRIAEDRLKKSLDLGAPLLGYLGAARAAQALGATHRRDHYLRLASANGSPRSELAVAVTQAELQISDDQKEQALATLMHLRSQAPSHDYVLELLKQVFEELKDWKRLLDVIPAMRKRKLVTRNEALVVEMEAFSELLKQTARLGKVAELKWFWDSIPLENRSKPELIALYARCLIAQNDPKTPEPILRAALDHAWDEDLACLYGLTEGEDVKRQLIHAEKWLKKHEESATLLLTLGRICARGRLWGKARSYLEASLAIEQRAETYSVLSDMLYELDDHETAAQCARSGLHLATGMTAASPDSGQPSTQGQEQAVPEGASSDVATDTEQASKSAATQASGA
jgi:HemY protein